MVNTKPTDQEAKPKSSEDKHAPGLAPTRIRTIMKSSADAGMITGDALHIMTKAAELFIQYVAKNTFQVSNCSKLIKYDHLATLIHSRENLDFLQQIIPRKITVKKYIEILQNHNDDDSASSSESEAEEEATVKKKTSKQ